MAVHTSSNWQFDPAAREQAGKQASVSASLQGAACPHCQFTTGGSGRPVGRQDGSYRCGDCGATWREVGANRAIPFCSSDEPRARQAFDGTDAATGHGNAGGRKRAFTRGNARQTGAWRALVPAAAAILAALALAWPFLPDSVQFGTPSGVPLSVAVTNVSQFNRDGRIAVKVEGRIENRTAHPVPVEAIEIVLAQHEGHRFYRWQYTPALQQLQPGASLRFATANGNVPQPASRVEIGIGGTIAARPL